MKTKKQYFLHAILILILMSITPSCSKFKILKLKKHKVASKKNVSKKNKQISLEKVNRNASKEEILEKGIPKTSQKNRISKPKPPINTKAVNRYCRKIDRKFHHWGWGKSRCEKTQWIHVRNSVKGDPLMWTVFGNEYEHKRRPKDCTMIFCGVHGDEITTIKFCFDVLESLKSKNPDYFEKKLVVVVPIVNPDSFFRRRPTRTNHRGVDINRNFPTRDWKKDALRLWKNRYRKDKRRYPGHHALSEPETVFHVNIIKRYKPYKIVSLHAPLTLLDYDGPADMKGKSLVGNMASNLLLQMSEQSKNYRIQDYPFFPGSLGNWAGNERGIHTYTLELPTTNNKKTKIYWLLFKDAIYSAIEKNLHHIDNKEKVAKRPIKKID